jgi:ferredoxin
MKIPVIDLGECVDCEACLELCPKVFRRNDAGYTEAIELGEYSKQELEEIIKNCPGQCITWEEI